MLLRLLKVEMGTDSSPSRGKMRIKLKKPSLDTYPRPALAHKFKCIASGANKFQHIGAYTVLIDQQVERKRKNNCFRTTINHFAFYNL